MVTRTIVPVVQKTANCKEIIEFGIDDVTKKRLGRYHQEQREPGPEDHRVLFEASVDCRDAE